MRTWLALLALCPVTGLGAGLIRGEIGFGVVVGCASLLAVALSVPIRWLVLDYRAWVDDHRES